MVVVANNNATESTGARGRHFERWARTDYDRNTIAEDIAALKSHVNNRFFFVFFFFSFPGLPFPFLLLHFAFPIFFHFPSSPLLYFPFLSFNRLCFVAFALLSWNVMKSSCCFWSAVECACISQRALMCRYFNFDRVWLVGRPNTTGHIWTF
jgi:hypothetical protein